MRDVGVPVRALLRTCDPFWTYILRSVKEEFPLQPPTSLTDLEQQRSELVLGFAQLKDLRPGSVTGIVRRCGKPTCHCAQPDDPGHGPTLRLTYKVEGKTVSEALPTPAAVRKAEQEIAEFRNGIFT